MRLPFLCSLTEAELSSIISKPPHRKQISKTLSVVTTETCCPNELLIHLIYYKPTNVLLYCNSLKSLHQNT